MVRQAHHSEEGIALISVLAVTAVALIIISVSIIVAIVNAKAGLGRLQSQKSYQATEAQIEEAVLRFIRWRDFSNPYPDWRENCLQIEDFECKMELDLNPDGGVIDVWGKTAGKIKHLQVEIDVLEDESVSVSARREIY